MVACRSMTADIPVIPFNRPTVEGDELVYVQQAIELGHLSGDGSFTRFYERCGFRVRDVSLVYQGWVGPEPPG